MNKTIVTYTPEELTKLFLAYEHKSGETPKTTEFEKVGLPHIRYYNRAFRNYTQFLRSLGREEKESSQR